MTSTVKIALAGIVACSLIGLRGYLVHQAAAFPPEAAMSPASTAMAHLDHAPRHGGLVLMNGDTHFEVALARDGSCRVYFSDAVRTALPASFASEVDLGLMSGSSRQSIPLQIDASRQFWMGALTMSDDAEAIVRVTYVASGEPPYWIDVPVSAFPVATRLSE
jgi:hypothetical protein